MSAVRADATAFCRRLPKVELHAHLNGSLSVSTLNALHELHLSLFPKQSLAPLPTWCRLDVPSPPPQFLTWSEVFAVFPIVKSLTDHRLGLARAVRDVIEDFADEGVTYLELRSTPRSSTNGLTPKIYIRTILETIEECHQRLAGRILVKYLVSIDRSLPVTEAESNVALASTLQKDFPHLLLGVDLSGNPEKGLLGDFQPILEQARASGLKLTVHLAEKPNSSEVQQVLHELKPDRIGHGTAIHPSLGGSPDQWAALLESRIPVEVCLTSNLLCSSVPSVEAHQIVPLRQAGHPFVICTDDKGVMLTSLSKEYEVAQSALGLSNAHMLELADAAIDYAFASNTEKRALHDIVQAFKEKEPTLR